MKLTVTPKAQKWFDSEIDLPETYGIRFLEKSTAKQRFMMVFRLECQLNSQNIL